MEIKISQVVAKMPEKQINHQKWCNFGKGTSGCTCGLLFWNQAIDEVSSLPISKDKVIGMVEIDGEKLAKSIFNGTPDTWIRAQYLKKTLKGWRLKEHSLLKKLNESYATADAIINAKSDILTIKGDV